MMEKQSIDMPELMTVEELGQYLRFTRKTLYKLLKRGDIPGIKIGNKWRFEKATIDRWLHQYMEGTKARFLVIDDDELILTLFKRTLEPYGHTVVTASNGQDGIECVIKWDFDLVFLDLKMPDVSGDEILKQIKSSRPDLPVTIITGYPGSEMMEKAVKLGPFGVMDKPFGSSDIVNALNSFLKVRQPVV